MSARPLIFYIDDEPHNLAVFEAALPETWDVKVFDNPLSAVEHFESMKPTVICSDQRMPGMKGIKLLELASKLSPQSVRILVTGYTDEDLVVESVRSARVFDYIRKPWDVDELVKRLEAAIEYNAVNVRREQLEAELKSYQQELIQRNSELNLKSMELERSLMQTQEANRELSCWIPPVVSWYQRHKKEFPIKKDLAVMAIDIVGSGAMYGKSVGHKSLRAAAIEEFTSLVLKHGGFIESTEGDAAYANFGLSDATTRPYDAALAVAHEFRAALQGIGRHHNENVECGIALHYAPQVEANISETCVNTPRGTLIQKRFYTSSLDVDLVHRMEKHVHSLKGSNIIFSQAFFEKLEKKPEQQVFDIGSHVFKGQTNAVELKLIKSSLVTEGEVELVKPKAA